MQQVNTDRRKSEVRRIRLALGRSAHFSFLPGATLDRLARLGHVARLRGGEVIHQAWQPAERLWVVLTGGLRVALPCEDGSTVTAAAIGEGSYFSVGSFVKDESVQSEAHTIGRTELAVFDMRHVREEFANDPVEPLLQFLYRRFDAVLTAYRDLMTVPLPQLLARRLLSQALSAGHVADGVEIELRVSQTDLAEILGASRSKVNSELRRLEESGAVRLGYRRVVVRDFSRLCKAAGSGVVPI